MVSGCQSLDGGLVKEAVEHFHQRKPAEVVDMPAVKEVEYSTGLLQAVQKDQVLF